MILASETQLSLFFTAHNVIGDFVASLPFVATFDPSTEICKSIGELSIVGKDSSNLQSMINQLPVSATMCINTLLNQSRIRILMIALSQSWATTWSQH